MKRSGENETIWIVIQMYIEPMLGISLYSYLYLMLVKMLCLFYYILCYLFNKIAEEGRTDYAWKRGWVRGSGVGQGAGGREAQRRYSHMNK
jgi:hypothetical protein